MVLNQTCDWLQFMGNENAWFLALRLITL